MSRPNKFYSLPEELLTLITQKLITDDNYIVPLSIINPRLKALRLSSIRFAYLKLALDSLFSRIHLIATPKRLVRLTRADIISPKIRTFVKEVILVAGANDPGIESLLLDEGTRTLWTGTLKALPNVREVIYNDEWEVNQDEDESGNPRTYYTSLVRANTEPAAAIGDALFATGALHFAPQATSGGKDAIAERVAEAVSAMLEKCKDKLESFCFSLGPNCPMQWPGEEVIDLPRLRELMLNGGSVRPRNLKAWMARMPSLDRLQFDFTHIHDDDPSSIMLIFDAIRVHPRNSWGIFVMFDCLWVNHAKFIRMRHHTNDLLRFSIEDVKEDPGAEVQRILSLYLSGRTEYESSLRS
ncbi:MAG: hypothetical protein M1836_004981 [Candelina mexicana]|nr:MAG: hypothetical protein M1836_004981 [Candelina mexicana]